MHPAQPPCQSACNCPPIALVLAPSGTRLARAARTSMACTWRWRLQLVCWVRPVPGRRLSRWQAAKAARQAESGSGLWVIWAPFRWPLTRPETSHLPGIWRVTHRRPSRPVP